MWRVWVCVWFFSFFLTTKCGVDRCSVSFSHSCCTRFLSRLFINILRDRSSTSSSSSSASYSSRLMLWLLLRLMYLLTILTIPTDVALFVLWRIARPLWPWKHDLLLCKFDDSVIPQKTHAVASSRQAQTGAKYKVLSPKKLCLVNDMQFVALTSDGWCCGTFTKRFPIRYR